MFKDVNDIPGCISAATPRPYKYCIVDVSGTVMFKYVNNIVACISPATSGP